MKYTPRLGLPQWDAEDRIARKDFNAMGQKLEERILSNFACKLIGIETSAFPDDAFSKLALGTGKYGYGVLVRFDGVPLARATVTGLSTISGSGTIVTDENGLAVGVSTAAVVNITVTPLEINLSAKTVAVSASSAPVTYVSVDIEQIAAGTIVTVSSSRAFAFTDDVTQADFCLVGGGGSGQRSTVASSAQGGQGGGTANLLRVSLLPVDEFRINIGAGGIALTAGEGSRSGGASTLQKNAATVATAAAGVGGAGGQGASSTVNKFDDGALGLAGGGDGGWGGLKSPQQGGDPSGGRGSYYYIPAAGGNLVYVNAGNATPYGGGGGGGASASYGEIVAEAGNGYQGVLYVRWR